MTVGASANTGSSGMGSAGAAPSRASAGLQAAMQAAYGTSGASPPASSRPSPSGSGSPLSEPPRPTNGAV